MSGYVGNYKVKIRKNPRYVLSNSCTGCGECKEVCPIEYPNEWDMNLDTRKAISVPFDQAVPLVYTINKDYCIECFKCVDACGDRRAINFEQKPEEVELEVGAIIIATGYDVYLPYDNPLLGYGDYLNVITSLEFERLILAAGPTGGRVLRMSDSQKPKKIAFIQCVGSRDLNKYPYCSNFCCMYTLKHVIQLKEKYKDEIEVYVFLFFAGKGFAITSFISDIAFLFIIIPAITTILSYFIFQGSLSLLESPLDDPLYRALFIATSAILAVICIILVLAFK